MSVLSPTLRSDVRYLPTLRPGVRFFTTLRPGVRPLTTLRPGVRSFTALRPGVRYLPALHLGVRYLTYTASWCPLPHLHYVSALPHRILRCSEPSTESHASLPMSMEQVRLCMCVCM